MQSESISTHMYIPHGVLLFLDEDSVRVPLGHQPPGQIVSCGVALSAGIHVPLEVIKLLLQHLGVEKNSCTLKLYVDY